MSKSLFAIGDIHGCAQELEELLAQLPLTSDSTLIFLGDYVDRGPQSRAVIDKILSLQKQFKVVALKGNHEAMFLDFLEHPETIGAALFILNGGTSTLFHYALPDGSFDVPKEHLNFLKNLRPFYATEEYFFVHAGVPNVALKDLRFPEHEPFLYWVRGAFLTSRHRWEKRIVHGHTPVAQVDVHPNRINLDTGCVFDGKLSAMEFPSERVYQVARRRRNEAAPDLPDLKWSAQRVARRFNGSIDVTLQNKSQRYVTLNYNQKGLLLRDHQTPKEPTLAVGQKISGEIGQENPVEFKGMVVRCEECQGLILYGVRIEITSV